MNADAKLTHTATMILQAIGAGCAYGLSVMNATGLPSGTVYPALRRSKKAGLIRSSGNLSKIADAGQRPARKYYRLTQGGRDRLAVAQKRYPLLAGLVAGAKGR